MTAEKQVRALVDRIEGDKAVLLVGKDEEHTILLPKELLPTDAGEGSVLTLIIRYEVEETQDTTEQVRALINRLTGAQG